MGADVIPEARLLFEQLRATQKAKDATLAQMLRLCKRHLLPSSPWASSADLRARRAQRQELVLALDELIGMLERGGS